MDYLSEIEDVLRFAGRSENTVSAYKTYNSCFIEYCRDRLGKAPSDVSAKEIREFLVSLKQERSLSDNTVDHAISEIRFLYEAVLGMKWNSKQIPHRKRIKYIPFVPSRVTVQAFLSSIKDPKKKAMLVIIYSSGLRISECCHLKCRDIEHKNHRIHINNGKGSIEHYAVLPDETYDIICKYWLGLPPDKRSRDWLFTQQANLENPIYPRYLEDFMPKHEASLGWPHRMTPHSLRHAYATHSYQDGVPIDKLSMMLGHSSVESTRIYIDLAMLGMEGVSSPVQGMAL